MREGNKARPKEGLPERRKSGGSKPACDGGHGGGEYARIGFCGQVLTFPKSAIGS